MYTDQRRRFHDVCDVCVCGESSGPSPNPLQSALFNDLLCKSVFVCKMSRQKQKKEGLTFAQLTCSVELSFWITIAFLSCREKKGCSPFLCHGRLIYVCMCIVLMGSRGDVAPSSHVTCPGFSCHHWQNSGSWAPGTWCVVCPGAAWLTFCRFFPFGNWVPFSRVWNWSRQSRLESLWECQIWAAEIHLLSDYAVVTRCTRACWGLVCL